MTAAQFGSGFLTKLAPETVTAPYVLTIPMTFAAKENAEAVAAIHAWCDSATDMQGLRVGGTGSAAGGDRVIHLDLRCSCGNKAKFSSPRPNVIDDMDRLFREFHSGDGHDVTPPPADATKT